MSKKKQSEPVLCPRCHGQMAEGFVPTVSDGLMWFPADALARVNPMAQALPGTTSWLRYARLKAWRCEGCSVVLIQYGKQMQDDDDEDAPA